MTTQTDRPLLWLGRFLEVYQFHRTACRPDREGPLPRPSGGPPPR